MNVSIAYFSLAEFMPQVKVEQVETVEGCSHEVKKKQNKNRQFSFYSSVVLNVNCNPQVALPADEEYKSLKPRVGKAAKV